MELVLLPHYNTINSLRKLQAADECSSGMQSLLLPFSPLVCVLGRTPPSGSADVPCEGDEKLIRKQMAALKDMLRNADGICHFGKIQVICGELILPLEVPFMKIIRDAGFIPEDDPRFILGTWKSQQQPFFSGEPPASIRVFRLALMKKTPLTKLSPSGQSDKFQTANTGFTWKYLYPFWLKF